MLAKLRHLYSADFWQIGDRGWYASVGVSTCVHVCVIAALASFWVQPQDEFGAPAVETRWSPVDSARDQQRLEIVEPIVLPPETNVGGAQSAHVMFGRQVKRAMPVDVPSTRMAMLANLATDEFAAVDLAEEVGAVSGDAGDLVAIGSGNGSGGDGAGAGFFGIRAAGRRFVYVVDCSRSMNHPHPSEAKTRFRRLKLELVKSIAAMDRDMKFYIVFFNDRVHPMPARSLQPAVPDLQHRFLHWSTKVRADGETDPRSALRYALRLQPDVIYFLTDGNFERPIQRDLRQLVQDRVAIHTFAFGSRAAEDLLKAVAAGNGGHYMFVP